MFSSNIPVHYFVNLYACRQLNRILLQITHIQMFIILYVLCGGNNLVCIVCDSMVFWPNSLQDASVSVRSVMGCNDMIKKVKWNIISDENMVLTWTTVIMGLVLVDHIALLLAVNVVPLFHIEQFVQHVLGGMSLIIFITAWTNTAITLLMDAVFILTA